MNTLIIVLIILLLPLVALLCYWIAYNDNSIKEAVNKVEANGFKKICDSKNELAKALNIPIERLDVYENMYKEWTSVVEKNKEFNKNVIEAYDTFIRIAPDVKEWTAFVNYKLRGNLTPNEINEAKRLNIDISHFSRYKENLLQIKSVEQRYGINSKQYKAAFSFFLDRTENVDEWERFLRIYK